MYKIRVGNILEWKHGILFSDIGIKTSFKYLARLVFQFLDQIAISVLHASSSQNNIFEIKILKKFHDLLCLNNDKIIAFIKSLTYMFHSQ